MKLDYYPDTDSLYSDFSSRPSVESEEISPGVVLDYEPEGNLVWIDIDHAIHEKNFAFKGEVSSN